MKREIKFRGKRIDNGKWAFGFIVNNSDGSAYIKDTDYNVNNGKIDIIPCKVNPETVGQFTGLKDKNGVEIYEGDWLNSELDKPMVVGWSNRFASFVLNRKGWAFAHWFGESCEPEHIEVIGNIHDNPILP